MFCSQETQLKNKDSNILRAWKMICQINNCNKKIPCLFYLRNMDFNPKSIIDKGISTE